MTIWKFFGIFMDTAYLSDENQLNVIISCRKYVAMDLTIFPFSFYFCIILHVFAMK